MKAATYLIAELGQNHNGSYTRATELINLAAKDAYDEFTKQTMPGFNAIKLQKRDLANEATESYMSARYTSPHAFGATYREHRHVLELSAAEHATLASYADSLGLEVVETVCAPSALEDILTYFTPHMLKVASRDLTNDRLLDALNTTRLPVILSTGMFGIVEIASAVERLRNCPVSILHCTSKYPTLPENVNLSRITALRTYFPGMCIGFSDHTIGVSAGVGAVALGAEIIEKHITFSREAKGTDHAGSLGPDGITRFTRDIRLAEQFLGSGDVNAPRGSAEARAKLARSVATARNMQAGERISERDVLPLSPGTGIPWHRRALEVIGRKLIRDVPKHEHILQEDIHEQ